MRRVLVSVSGKAGVGKSTTCRYLVRHHLFDGVLSFAGRLRSDLREQYFPDFDQYADKNALYTGDAESFLRDIGKPLDTLFTIRQACQWFGAHMRSKDPEYFVDAMRDQLGSVMGGAFCIDDVRYPNELALAQNPPDTFVPVSVRIKPYDGHVPEPHCDNSENSETALDQVPDEAFDVVATPNFGKPYLLMVAQDIAATVRRKVASL